MRSLKIGSALVFLSFAVLAWNAGCGGSSSGGPDGGGDDGGGGGGGSSGSGGCVGLTCGVDASARCVAGTLCPAQSCPTNSPTTITGTVYDPAGINPLPFVQVYVPHDKVLDKLPKGASCGNCQLLYTNTVLAAGQTKFDGTFEVKGAVPVGDGIPLVVQVGKWRRLYHVTVKACQANPYPGMLQLPKNSMEGDLPDIAVSTGGADSLECLISRVGVSDSEYVNGASPNGHIHVFQGGQGNSPGPTIDTNTPISSKALWGTPGDLQKNDLVLLSCEGGETDSPNPTALDAYVAQGGGRVFASHFHYKWFTDFGGPFPGYNLATWTAGANDTGTINAKVQTQTPAGMPFPKGQTLHDWLKLIGALNTTPPVDELPIQLSRFNVVVTNKNAYSTPWINADSNVPAPGQAGMTEYFSWDEPINGGEHICGRVVYSDLHVGAASADYGNLPNATPSATPAVTTGGIVPTGCKHAVHLSPQEAALEYMLFDLSACPTPPSVQPPPLMTAQ